MGKAQRQEVMRSLELLSLGLSDYQQTWDLQRSLFTKRLAGEIGDTLILCEHPHTYTVGKNGTDNLFKHLLLNKAELAENGIQVFEIDRGGDITYHGPGQLVAYPILDLNDHYRDVHRYLRDLEEVVIKVLAQFAVEGIRIDGVTGVWVEDQPAPAKICAIGVKVTRWITMHGFAFNINTNLDYFNGIIPCGISDKKVISLAHLKSKICDMDEIKDRVVQSLQRGIWIDTAEKRRLTPHYFKLRC